jgi:pimeloyl-ACP methyl ester carboxylesterase
MTWVPSGTATRALFLAVLLLLGMAGAGRAAPLGGMTEVGGGVRLHFLDFGGRGDPVILLAGLGNTAWIYEEFGTALSRNYRVFALTRRGHGASDQPASGYDPDTLADDIRHFMDARGIRRAHLIGHSLAGVELTRFASKYPERVGALVYLEAAYDWSAEGPVDEADPIQQAPPSPADRRSATAFLAYVRSTRPDLVRYWGASVRHDLQAETGRGTNGMMGWRTRDDVFGALLSGASRAPPDYRRVRAPALALYAEEDESYRLPANAAPALRAGIEAFENGPLAAWRVLSRTEFSQGVRGGEVAVMDSGHHLFLHRPAETLRRVESFLSHHPIAR